jgi:hypothetical protein
VRSRFKRGVDEGSSWFEEGRKGSETNFLRLTSVVNIYIDALPRMTLAPGSLFLSPEPLTPFRIMNKDQFPQDGNSSDGLVSNRRAGAATAQLEGTFEPVRIVQSGNSSEIIVQFHKPDRRQGRSDSYRTCGLVVSDNFTMFDRALAKLTSSGGCPWVSI